MKSGNVLSAFLLSNPVYRGMAEKILLVGTGICGLVFSWKAFPIFPFSHVLGVILILLSCGIHAWAHKKHEQAHKESKEIETVVTEGAFSKIRHPLYLSNIAMNIGIGIAFGVMVTFIIALLTVIHWALTALEEEAALTKKFPDEYARYTQQVRWRMIPWIF